MSQLIQKTIQIQSVKLEKPIYVPDIRTEFKMKKKECVFSHNNSVYTHFKNANEEKECLEKLQNKCFLKGEVINKKIGEKTTHCSQEYQVIIKNNDNLYKYYTERKNPDIEFSCKGVSYFKELLLKDKVSFLTTQDDFKRINLDYKENNDNLKNLDIPECKSNYTKEEYEKDFLSFNEKKIQEGNKTNKNNQEKTILKQEIQENNNNSLSFTKGYEDIFFYGLFVSLFLNIFFITLLLRKKK